MERPSISGESASLNLGEGLCCKEEAPLNVVIRTLDTKEFRLQVGLLHIHAPVRGGRD